MKRGSGILLAISSLPSKYGIGDFGPHAYQFVDFLSSLNQTYWQILPLTVTDQAFGNSPYSSISAFAGNPLLISPDRLLSEGYVSESDLNGCSEFSSGSVAYDAVVPYKYAVLDVAFQTFKKKKDTVVYTSFCEAESGWLDDFAFFAAYKKKKDSRVWAEWDPAVRDRDAAVCAQLTLDLCDDIEREKFFQFLFFTQWERLKTYAAEKQISIIGDVPIYVNYDSVDVWAHSRFFKLDDDKRPYCVAGVPPDYFSETGQRWGNPVYNWDSLKASGYGWWIDRFRHVLRLYDIVRIDHFRGFVAHWEIPADEETAINGEWVPAPAVDFFQTIQKTFPAMPFIAEDLGLITDDVRAVMKQFGLPGMKVLLFAFEKNLPSHPYIPHNYCDNSVVYTGTHDNNTIHGWFADEATEINKEMLAQYFNAAISGETVHRLLIRLALLSVSACAIIPMQDLLGLGGDARMNTPATGDGNWEWRVRPDAVNHDAFKWVIHETQLSGRSSAVAEGDES